jgi:fatty acid synthase
LVDTLRVVGVTADGIVGHSVGELGCAYADGSLTAEETVLAAYWRGRCIRESNLPPGGMAAVGGSDIISIIYLSPTSEIKRN